MRFTSGRARCAARGASRDGDTFGKQNVLRQQANTAAWRQQRRRMCGARPAHFALPAPRTMCVGDFAAHWYLMGATFLGSAPTGNRAM